VPVRFLGNLPPDEHLARALQLGRPVVEAFPMASASIALREVAARLLSVGQSQQTAASLLER
jgi:flagellar biosynthesis protein FlhG